MKKFGTEDGRVVGPIVDMSKTSEEKKEVVEDSEGDEESSEG